MRPAESDSLKCLKRLLNERQLWIGRKASGRPRLRSGADVIRLPCKPPRRAQNRDERWLNDCPVPACPDRALKGRSCEGYRAPRGVRYPPKQEAAAAYDGYGESGFRPSIEMTRRLPGPGLVASEVWKSVLLLAAKWGHSGPARGVTAAAFANRARRFVSQDTLAAGQREIRSCRVTKRTARLMLEPVVARGADASVGRSRRRPCGRRSKGMAKLSPVVRPAGHPQQVAGQRAKPAPAGD